MKEKKLLPAGRLSRFIFALTLPLANMLYVLTNRVMAERGQALIWKATIDDYIPFIAAAIIPYIWWHLQILISLIWFISTRKKTDILYRYVTSIVLVTIISIFIFVAMPTRVIRPQVSGTDIFSQLTRFLYSIDEPYNCFPSLHVAYALIAAWFWQKIGPDKTWFKICSWTIFIFISISTILTGQHYYPDIPGGIMVATLSMYLVETAYKKYICPDKKKDC